MFSTHRLLSLLLLTLFSIPALALQSKDAYKIKSTTTGLLCIRAEQLLIKRPELANKDPRYFHLTKNGNEIPFFISDTNATWTNGNSILFYAEKNDGFLDRLMYDKPGAALNPYHSMYSDTAVYFLSIDETQKGNYYKPASNGNASTWLKEIEFEITKVYADSYFLGKDINAGATLSEYTLGEGFSSSRFAKGASLDKILETPYINTAKTVELQTYLSGQSDAVAGNPNYNHHVTVQLLGNSTLTLLDTMYKGYTCVSKKMILSGSSFLLNSTLKFSSIDDIAAQTDYNTVPYIKYSYTRTSNFTDATFLKFKLSNPLATNLLFSNIQQDSILLFLLERKEFYEPNAKNDSLYFKINSEGANERYVIASIKQKDLSSTYTTEKCSLLDFDFSNEENDLIIISARKLATATEEYLQYKKSKGISSILVYAEDLYNSYTFGYHHPMAIKKFVENYSSTANKPALNLLLLGKGMQSNTYRDNGIAERDLVPSVGVPPSDLLYVSSFNYNPITPTMGVGRVTAENNEEVLNYLDKVKEHDALAEVAQWRKNIIHATGGRSIGENNTFTGALKLCEGIAIQPSLGAKITNFNKKVNEPITDNYREKIVELTDQGISLLTYFGHGANYFVEINFGEPEALNNKGKYPVYFLNGCAVGNCASDNSMGENYIHAKNRGAIGWLAASDEGFPSYLSLFDRYFYENAFRYNYGESIGAIHKETIKKFLNSADSLNIVHARQLFYQGDPSIKLYAPNTPDYSVQTNSLYQTKKYFVNNDSIELACIIRNPGKAISDSIEIKIERTINNQNIVTYPIKKIGSIHYMDTIYFTVERTKSLSGTNKIVLTIDPENKIQEYAKTNNSSTIEFYLSSYSPTIIQPRNSSILKENKIHLVVQCNDIYATNIEYTVEVDTASLFNSLALKRYTWEEQQLLRKDIAVNFPAYKTIYLRVKIKGNSQESDWYVSSFKYIPNNTNSWMQNSTQELNAALFSNIAIANNALTFVDNTIEFAINTRGDNARTDSVERRIRINNSPPVYVGENINGIALFALHPKNLSRFSYESAYNLFANTPDYPFEIYRRSGLFNFNTQDLAAQDSLLLYLQSIPDGYVVAGYNGLNANLKALPENILQAFETLGLAKIKTIENGESYAFVGYKGASIGTAAEKTTDLSSTIPPDEQFIRLNFTHSGKWDKGSIRSEVIGPVKKWGSVNWDFNTDISDVFTMQVIGIDKNGNHVVLNTSTNSSDSLNITTINADTYSRIFLQSNFADNINFNPAHFNLWGMRYELPKDASVLPHYKFMLAPNKTFQGDTVNYQFSFINLGEELIDTVNLLLNTIDENRNVLTLKTDTVYSFNALDTLTKSYKIPTRNLLGKVILESKISTNSEELIPYNNSYESTITIDKDVKSPRLTVLIDGKTPMQNDLISPNPIISISVKDENKFLLLNDSTNVEMYLKRPNNSTYVKVNYSNPDLLFSPATAVNGNELKINYQPKLMDDGMYSLKVKVKDASNNTVQNNDYTIDFEVVNKSTITHFFPYPNPFTTQTQFVFTLTGEVIPEDIKIQIMTISGKIVKEITRAEIGDIHIGHNITDFRWNGTDQYGDRLANGVYLYRVILKDKSTFQDRTTSADKYFNQGFGKIYLMK